MGTYLNVGNDEFLQAIRSEIYVDKTGLIKYTNKQLNTSDSYVYVSRPQRFGKSMTVAMLAAYYSCGCDSAELFKGYEIEKDKSYLEHLNRYDVIYLNMQQLLTEAEDEDVIEYLERTVIKELREVYGDYIPAKVTRLPTALAKIYVKTKKDFVFLIDEWDCVMRERQESEELQRQYLDFLCYLLKDQSYVALAYMTGILPIKKIGLHSSLNMFWEFSMTSQRMLEQYTGFTDTEVKTLCERYGMCFEETNSWYGGYQFRKIKQVYNPKSVVEAMTHRKFSSYWNATETYDVLKAYTDMDFDGLREDILTMLGGEHVKVETGGFLNDMYRFMKKDHVLTLLIHLGYLGYDEEREEVFIPNKEILEEFEKTMCVCN